MIIGKLCALLGLFALLLIVTGVLVLIAWLTDNGAQSNPNNLNKQDK